MWKHCWAMTLAVLFAIAGSSGCCLVGWLGMFAVVLGTAAMDAAEGIREP